ncbi:CopD family protein [Saccharopolyspora rosea]|uniref:Copper resistance D family protein n=1 Tax=Saccharopolyspora rosea TaxID=524884 RepID=A0ABW3FM11_9PSEU
MAADADAAGRRGRSAGRNGARTGGGLGDRRAKCGVAVALVGGALVAALLAAVGTDGGTVPGVPNPAPIVHFGLPAARVLLDLSALATVGFGLLPRLLGPDRPKRSEHVVGAARRASVISALCWMVCALVSLVLQARELSPGSALTTRLLVGYVTTVPGGLGAVASAGVALCCAVLGLAAMRFGESVPAELRTAVALLGLLPLPLTGHATDWRYHDLGMISMELHVIAAALWAGGLLGLVLFAAPRRGLLASALPRFSKLATALIAVVAASGLFNGLAELVNTPGVGAAGLVSTAYGRVVLLKIGCMALLAAVSAQLRFRLLPRIQRHQRTALAGWAAAELGVMGVAYGLGAVLSRAPVLV